MMRAHPPGGCREGLQGLLARLLLGLALCLLSLPAASAAADAGAVRYQSAQRVATPAHAAEFSLPARHLPDTALPATDAWQTVTLPDAGLPRALHPPAGNQLETLWYRVSLDTAQWPASEPLYFYLPRWQTVGQVALYGDGELLWRSEGDRVYNSFNRPVWVALEGPDIGKRPRELVLRIDTAAGLGAGISSIWVGPSDSLWWRYATRWTLQCLVPLASAAGFLALGVFGLALWLSRRRDNLYLLCFIASALFAVRTLHYGFALDTRFFPASWYGWLTLNSLVWLVVISAFVNFRLSRSHYPWLERALLGFTIASTLLSLPWWDSDSRMAGFAVWSYAGMIVLSLVAVPCALWSACRKRARAAIIMTLSSVVLVLISIHDLALQNYRISLESAYLLPYAQIEFFLVFMYILFRRYVLGVDGLERSQQELAERLQAREAELAESYAQLREVERREVLNDERQRLMEDMHDGLGSTLTGALRMVEQRRGPADDIAQLLRDCIDDLKLTIDSLEPVEADLSLLLATFRFRLQPRLEAAGLPLTWQVGELPQIEWLSSSNALHVLRIMQEAVTNALKHSQATELHVSAEADEHGVTIRIQDNGIGLPASLPLQATGRGVRNIRNRAHALQGVAQWRRAEGGTCFSLWLPLRLGA